MFPGRCSRRIFPPPVIQMGAEIIQLSLNEISTVGVSLKNQCICEDPDVLA